MNSPSAILAVSDRGQITIPKELRRRLKATHVVCTFEDDSVILRPLQTRDEFLDELESAKKLWKNRGGLTIHQMKKKYHL